MENSKKNPFINPQLTVEDLSLALFKANKELDQLNKILTEKNSALLDAEQERTEIFSNISHDLRSPITAINNAVEYLLSVDKIEEHELKTTLNLIQRRSSSLETMINDIFLLSSLDTDSKKIYLEDINLGMFLEDFFYSCEADKKYTNRSLILDVPEHFPYIVSLDCKLFYRVLDNLFTNALKYSNNLDTITLSSRIVGQDLIKISVLDTGIGIAENDLLKIFDRTYMVTDARTPGITKGCGLGLSIAKSIIEKLNGKIQCESRLGIGSDFSIFLPIKLGSDHL